MLKVFLSLFRLIFGRKTVKNELPKVAGDFLKQFKGIVYQKSVDERISWFGWQVLRYIEEHPDSVRYGDGTITIDVSVTSLVPGDFGDEIFGTMYSTEKSLNLILERRDMKCNTEDDHLPDGLRSKEHFVSVHWVVHKRLEKKETEAR